MLCLLAAALASPLDVMAVIESGDDRWLLDAEADRIIREQDGHRVEVGPVLALADFAAHDGVLYALRGDVVYRLEDGAWKEWKASDGRAILGPPMVWRDGVVWTARHDAMPAPFESPGSLDARTLPMHWTWSSDGGQWGRRPLDATEDPVGLAVTDDGAVWFAQQGRLSTWRDGRWTLVDGPALGFQAQLLADGDALWVWSPYGEIRRLEDGAWSHHAIAGPIEDACVHDGQLFALQHDRLVRVAADQVQQALFPKSSRPRHLVADGRGVAAWTRSGERVEPLPTWEALNGEVLASAREIRGAWFIPGGRAWLANEDAVLPVLWVDTGDGPRIRALAPNWEAAVDRWTGRAAVLHRRGDDWRVSSLSLLDDRRPVLLPGVYAEVTDLKVLDDAVFVTHIDGITRIHDAVAEQVAPPGHVVVAADGSQLVTHDTSSLWHHPLDGVGAPRVLLSEVQGAMGDGVVLAALPGGMQVFDLDGSPLATPEPAEIWDVLGRTVHSGVCDGPRCPLTDVTTGEPVGVLVVPEPMRFDPNISNGTEALFWSRHTLMRQPYDAVTSP